MSDEITGELLQYLCLSKVVDLSSATWLGELGICPRPAEFHVVGGLLSLIRGRRWEVADRL